MYGYGDYEAEAQVQGYDKLKDDKKILKEISQKLEQIQKREEAVINKEKILNLPEKSTSKEKKRRRSTHFTISKSKKK